ncbi:hypothetical protein R50072_06740 [Simiduia litorea]|uniref:hypothetical protein n=1 Tax=Simiduia litorea TaxID=1435348 RepID=UPI0036F3D6AE
MWKLFIGIALCVAINTQTQAEPSEFIYQDQGRGSAKEKTMRRLYDIIPNSSGSAAKARLVILRTMQSIRGPACLLEEEGEGFITCRWDYKGHAIFHRIEYNDQAIQIKYGGGINAYECENLVDGFCYKIHRNYFKYGANFRKDLSRTL